MTSDELVLIKAYSWDVLAECSFSKKVHEISYQSLIIRGCGKIAEVVVIFHRKDILLTDADVVLVWSVTSIANTFS